MRFLEITYYENNDMHLEDENWINKSNVNLFIDGEIDTIFNDSIYEEINMRTCMKHIKEKYPNAILDEVGCYQTGWNYKIYRLV